MNSKKNEITFIGFGNMGSAIVKGILKENIYSHINIIENDKSKFINSHFFNYRKTDLCYFYFILGLFLVTII